MKTAYVINHHRLDDSYVIGVASTADIAKDMIKEYYGKYELLQYRDVRDSGIEFEMTIKVEND